ncbi:DUF1707 domain-containing protein [Nocardioides sp. YIM 152315]|uniref:DUF1707 SHOCT-like domain-containing protein n=1 Tax=Nocardioides sp. YIM 152315 TaxID=3031760 RepID=UPI0023DA0D56|nr:DUF1707 domain-containing protein [Nocardioides sp. YIM 152315]MDF1604383.1 DUF1707 domain-containing protein [Nocardioides sp. YIM 152315]
MTTPAECSLRSASAGDPGKAGEGHLRISDVEREQAAAALGEHFAQGRLTADEHGERLDRIWAARTRGDLAPVFRDLPGPTGPTPERHASRSRPPTYWSRGATCRGGFPPPLFLVIAALVVLTVVTHVPFILLGAAAALFVVLRHRGARWARPVR